VAKPLGYEWRCHCCDAANAPTEIVCAACKFPAVASTEDIERGVVQPGRYQQMVNEGVPLPLRVLYIIAIVVGGTGLFLIKLAISLPMFLVGVIATAIGWATAWVADLIDARRPK
jgi:hypothetical protein